MNNLYTSKEFMKIIYQDWFGIAGSQYSDALRRKVRSKSRSANNFVFLFYLFKPP